MGIHDPRLARLTGIPVFIYLFDLLAVRRPRPHRPAAARAQAACCAAALSFEGPSGYTPHRNERGDEYFGEACAKGWEGLIAKRADSPYVHGRSGDWLKLKCASSRSW